MVKTVISVVLSFALIFGLSFYEVWYVRTTFDEFYKILNSLYQKTESHVATYEDGTAVRSFWEHEKRTLHVWLPHNILQEMDYHIDEAIGYLYNDDYANALAQLEVAREISLELPRSYSLGVQNIF
jgi:hypothetical protein